MNKAGDSTWFEKIQRPIIGLAPMHQVSRSDLRIAARESGADVVFTEMVASEAIIRRVPQAFEMLEFSALERPIIVQIFGNQPDVMADAARIVESEFAPEGIDINFGCPVQKAEKQGFGSCQLKHPESAARIVKAVKKAVSLPVSVKIRIPTTDQKDTRNFVYKMVSSGISMITIHGRTPTQKYRGEADWSHAYAVKESFSNLIVLGSGDIKSVQDYKKRIGNLDGVLIGRWAKNHPAIFREIKEAAK